MEASGGAESADTSNLENKAGSSANIPQIEVFSGGDVQVTVGKIVSGRISRINDLYVDKLGLNDADYYELFKTIDIKNIQVSTGGGVSAVGRDNQSYEILYVSDVPDGSLGVQLMPNKSAFLSASSLGSSSSKSSEKCDGLKVVSISKQYLETISSISSSLPLRLNDVIVKVNSVPLSNLSADAAVKIFKSSMNRKLVVIREKNISVKTSSSGTDYTGFNSFDYFGITANGKEDVLQSDDAVEMNRRSSAYANITDGAALLRGCQSLHSNWLSLRQRYVDRVDAGALARVQGKRKAAALPVQGLRRLRGASSSSSPAALSSDPSERSRSNEESAESEDVSSVQIIDISEDDEGEAEEGLST